ncbi:MAG: hypothetical protein RI922_998 [Bacteroidota bacterium]|jgi:hypothetical protein
MTKLRNPFAMRASERIESSGNFLRLYDPSIVNVLIDKHNEGKLWDTVLFIHSSPGGGKTSLLRVFQPSSLKALTGSKSVYRSFYLQMEKLEVVKNDRIELLGVSILCTRNYENLEDLNVSSGNKIRYFFALLNARIVIATLRSILQFEQKSFPDGLDEIEYSYADSENYFLGETPPTTGRGLFDWASNIEKNVYDAIDSFILDENTIPKGQDELFSFSILKPEYFKIQGKTIFRKILFMLDDTHKLSSSQRSKLESYVVEKRGNFSIWIAERLESLTPKENLSNYIGRDYEVINLERYWDKKGAKYRDSLVSIANLRASLSSDGVESFENNIETNLNEDLFKQEFLEVINSTHEKLRKLTSYTEKYNEWIDYLKTDNLSPSELAVIAKKVEILIARSLNRKQLTLEFPYTQEELTAKLLSDVSTTTAKLFLSKESSIPFYHGIDSLVNLSSNNIEQFLNFSSDLYEEMLSNKILGLQVSIDAEKQEKIIKRAVEKKWEELTKLIPYASDVIRFLNAFGDFSQSETYQANAPYPPGINGFVIKEKKGQIKLIQEGEWPDNPAFERLVNVISTCVSYNLLEIRRSKQGEKKAGEKSSPEWDVYYLNRWLCVKFDLPLGYGGFRHINPNVLTNWIINDKK